MFRGADRIEVVAFGIVVLLVPWLLVGSAAALSGIAGPAVRRWVQVFVLGVLAALVALHVLKRATDARGTLLLVVAVAVGFGFGLAYRRFGTVALWARYAAIAPVVFLGLFLVSSPVSSLVFPGDADTARIDGRGLPRHVVFVLFDEVPTASLLGADAHIDAERFPNFARFADDASWYRNYTSVSGSTHFAVPALLSGTDPRDVLPTAANYPRNLFTMLGGQYEVHASEVVTALCPPSVCGSRSRGVSAIRQLTDDALDVWQQQISLHDSDRQVAAGFVEEAEPGEAASSTADRRGSLFDTLSENATTSPARLTDFVDRITPKTPSVEFVHVLLPHQPWHFYPSGVQYPFPDRDPGLQLFISARWGPTGRPAELGRQRHLLQTQYVDAQLGRVVAALRDRGIYDDSLIVVTADHGAVFAPGEEPRPGIGSDEFPRGTYDQIMWAPLLIKVPHQQAGRISDANVQSVDLLPTIADLIGIEVPWKLDGIPASERRRSDQKSFFTSSTVAFDHIALGTRVDVNGAEGLARMLADNQRAFAPSRDPDWGLYRVGPYADLIGRPVDELPTGPAASLDVTLHDPGAYGSVDPKSGSVPGLLRGELPRGTDVTIAVSVNGTLAGVSASFTDDPGPSKFAILIPDFLFAAGRNDVRVFSVEGAGPTATLRPVRVAGLGGPTP